MALTISGNIKENPLPDVLDGLRAMKATGTLVIQWGGSEKSLFLKEGKIVFASSKDISDRLGEVMVRAGKLTRENLNAALQIGKTAGFKKLGAILVEKQFVTPQDLFGALKLQVKEIIYSVFILEDGTYRFEPVLPPDIIPLQINMQELIREIIDRIKSQA